mmetsp:Transcript_125987/g.218304  ORF Transcript_125987/g.218304 Transcript_125987/m.218304 type:complete len:205 (-) Transcript_125987:762-1376(-)
MTHLQKLCAPSAFFAALVISLSFALGNTCYSHVQFGRPQVAVLNNHDELRIHLQIFWFHHHCAADHLARAAPQRTGFHSDAPLSAHHAVVQGNRDEMLTRPGISPPPSVYNAFQLEMTLPNQRLPVMPPMVVLGSHGVLKIHPQKLSDSKVISLFPANVYPVDALLLKHQVVGVENRDATWTHPETLRLLGLHNACWSELTLPC